MLLDHPACGREARLREDLSREPDAELIPDARLVARVQAGRDDADTVSVQAVLARLPALGHDDVVRNVVAPCDEHRPEVHDLRAPFPALPEQGMPVRRAIRPDVDVRAVAQRER